jgi:hypothetical protein
MVKSNQMNKTSNKTRQKVAVNFKRPVFGRK